ncbi:peripheral-type benzodiazepine receptor-associated protein 1-like [Xyrauchen texanus]|uniref:peripheral-type benzodiazepine receptor-associated protein 1-like n=1 Tax=Xyrauchen texanus TaxID=154827 RepID=UPI0022427DF6|nr:peripheral-type benzodiazepine receptor-associated protein 1-like [Xyrauchen texanus]
MGKNYDNNNPQILSSKKGATCHKHSCCASRPGADLWRDVEHLRTALEVERSRNKQAHRRFSLELRRQREEARVERERALRELTYRHEQQRSLELLQQRKTLGRERTAEVRRLLRWQDQERQHTVSSTLKRSQELHHHLAEEIAGNSKSGIQRKQGSRRVSTSEPGCKGNGTTYRKLEELIKSLLALGDGEQVALPQRLQQEVDLEKSYFLCHLLEAHRRPSQAETDPKEEHKGCIVNLTRPRSKSCVQLLSGDISQGQDRLGSSRTGKLALCRSQSLSQTPQSVSPPPMKTKKKKKEQAFETPPFSTSSEDEEVSKGDLFGDLPQSCSPEKWDLQRSSTSETTSPEKCSPSRCPEDNMEDLIKLIVSVNAIRPDPHKPSHHGSPTPDMSSAEPESPAGPGDPDRENPEESRKATSGKDPGSSMTNGNGSVMVLGKRHHSLYEGLNGGEAGGFGKNGRSYGFLVQQNSELLRALEETEKTCAALREENGILRKSSSPETEEKVTRLRRKNTELAVIAKRLEERARKLQEANLKVVNSPMPMKAGTVEQYKRAFARQRARDLAQHAYTLLSKDKQIAALQTECRQLESRPRQGKGPIGVSEFERLLKESQKEVLRLQRQLSVTSVRDQSSATAETPADRQTRVAFEAPPTLVDEAPVKREETPGEGVEPETQVKPGPGTSPAHELEQTTEERLHLLESELGKKRKECESLEHEVRKRQKRCLDLESQLVEECSRNERLVEEAELLRRRAQLLQQSPNDNDELKEQLSDLSAQHSSVLEENQRLRAKLENLEQVLKHMREVAERRQQLELEHEQALAILKFKHDEIKRLQRAQLFAKREHEGVVQMLEHVHMIICVKSKVRDLEDKCRSQSEQFGLLSHELDKFRVQASKIDLSGPELLSSASLTQLTNGLPGETDMAAVLRSGSTPRGSEPSHPERSPVTRHRELPTIKSGSSSSTTPPRSETTHLSPKSAASHTSPRKTSPTHEVDTASEVEELDIDVSPAPYVNKGAAKLQVFIARYSYNPFDGPNDNPEVELPLTAGEYIYVNGDMDDDGFFEGELMDGRRGLVPSNFVERISDDDFISSQPHQTGEISHNSFQESCFHSGSERLHHHHHLRFAHSASERTETSTTASAPGDIAKANGSTPSLNAPLTNGLDLDVEEVGVDTVPYPRKLTLIKQLAKSIIISWEAPLVPVGWGSVFSYNVYVDFELRLNVPFGTQTKAVLERLDLPQKAYRIAVQSLTEHGNSDQLRCSMLVGRDVCVAPTHLHVERITATSASLTWLPSNSNYVHIVSLNDEECELVKAGCYSLCLSNLTPNLHYRIKVEARTHRTAWELPPESRERKTAVTSFTTLTAGPPDAPLDVQLERGPSPGIAQISWLPVTIDAAGTSNGVRVTGYTIYADKKKVLEVSSPTAGSALIGPSQIQTLQAAHELTVRTMSPFGESVDSLPVNVPSKLPAIMSGVPLPQYQSVPATASVLAAGVNPEPAVCATSLSAAITPVLPHAAVLDEHTTGPVRGVYINTPKAVARDAQHPAMSCVEAWAKPEAAPFMVAMEAQEALSMSATHVNPTASVPVPIATPATVVMPVPVATPASMALPNPLTMPAPMITPAPVPTPASMAMPVPMTVPPPLAMPAPLPASVVVHTSVPVQSSVAPAVLNPSRETESFGAQRPVTSLSDFLEDPRAKLHTPPPSSTAPKVNISDAHPLRPPNESPFESETEEDRENTRLVSIEEFLQPVPQPRIKVYAGGLMDPPPDFHGESSRSDLSDILEEEDEDLYSEPIVDLSSRCYRTAPKGRSEMWETDSDEEILERITKLPPQVQHNKQLFSIPEVTEDEDNTESEPHTRPSPGRTASGEGRLRRRDGHRRSLHKTKSELPVVRYRGTVQRRARPKVHYADTVDTINYLDEEDVELDSDSRLYAGPSAGSLCVRRTPQKVHADRLRREALLRNQMTSDLAGVVGSSGAGQRPYLLSKSVHHLKSPTGPSTEIDVEYGTDNDEETQGFDRGEVVLDQMSSEWWVEGGNHDYHHLPLTSRPQPELPPSNRSWESSGREASLADAGAASCGPCDPKSTRSERRLVRESRAPGENEARIFVALFPYDPAVMSPNPDAAEEELPFKEGQIIKVYGDKDADGFYHGEAGGRHGYVPCNMVSEIQVDDEETRDQLLMQGFLSTEASMEKIDARLHAQLLRRPAPPPKPKRSKKGVCQRSLSPASQISPAFAFTHFLPSALCILLLELKGGCVHEIVLTVTITAGVSCRMVAIFDYDPRESSPNADIEAELTFSTGDIIYVFGDMDDDGFYYGDLNGQKGLVPSNFLQAIPETEKEAVRTEHTVTESRRDSQVIQCDSDPMSSCQLEPVPPAQTEPNPEPDSEQKPTLSTSPPETLSDTSLSVPEKKKKGFFSKGRKLFRKLGSSKKE